MALPGRPLATLALPTPRSAPHGLSSPDMMCSYVSAGSGTGTLLGMGAPESWVPAVLVTAILIPSTWIGARHTGDARYLCVE